jgi:hypothetical protein
MSNVGTGYLSWQIAVAANAGEWLLQIAVSGKFSNDLFDSASAVTETLRSAIDAAGLQSIQTGLDYLVFFPVLISDKFNIDGKSRRSYSRKEAAEFVHVEIDAALWPTQTAHEQLLLMMRALEEAILSTRSSRIDDRAKGIIIERLNYALQAYSTPTTVEAISLGDGLSPRSAHQEK